ncbi:MAG: sigma-70 family RNA polymerase sigma factor [Luteolibacter sp.]|uniref:sigma-70 family RNA polymerase sigma factor n=1 Tax=Luteolibacter sp. TaxID=1962973 RepID=UPI003264767F
MKPPPEQNADLAFTLDLASHQAALAAFLRSLLPVGTDPRDLQQEVNITLWKKKEQFEPGTNFKAWTFQIARYHVLNHFRVLKRDRRLVFDDELVARIADHAESSIDNDMLQARRNALRGCLVKLRQTDRELLEMRYADPESIEDFARRQNRNPGTVRALLRNIRKALARCIRMELGEEALS